VEKVTLGFAVPRPRRPSPSTTNLILDDGNPPRKLRKKLQRSPWQMFELPEKGTLKLAVNSGSAATLTVCAHAPVASSLWHVSPARGFP
jgi:hypothetical protein